MMQKTYWHRVVRSLAIALILAVSLWLIGPPHAAAQSLTEYFEISYEPVSLSKNQVKGSEVFHATIRGQATCAKDLPVSVGEASIASRVVAKHALSGTEVTLNSSYTVAIKPFPSKKGDNIKIEQVVPMNFPAQAESGEYNVVGRLIKAEVKVGPVSIDVTGYLPREQVMGSVEYIAPEPTPAPVPKPTPTPVPAPAPTPAPPERGLVWWVWLIVAVAIATTVANIILFLRYRIS